MDAQLQSWLEAKYGADARDPELVRLQDFGELALAGEVAVWHPLDDMHEAPRIPFAAAPKVQALWVGDELAGYVLQGPGSIATWHDLGDASTDTDRFFLLQGNQAKAVIDWMNEDVEGFETLGGTDVVQTVDHPNGTRVVVIESLDGNAQVHAGYTEAGQLACAFIEC